VVVVCSVWLVMNALQLNEIFIGINTRAVQKHSGSGLGESRKVQVATRTTASHQLNASYSRQTCFMGQQKPLDYHHGGPADG